MITFKVAMAALVIVFGVWCISHYFEWKHKNP